MFTQMVNFLSNINLPVSFNFLHHRPVKFGWYITIIDKDYETEGRWAILCFFHVFSKQRKESINLPSNVFIQKMIKKNKWTKVFYSHSSFILNFWKLFHNFIAQEKFEWKSRFKKNDVPIQSLNFIDSLSWSNKVKWYLEEGIERKSIEAKI